MTQTWLGLDPELLVVDGENFLVPAQRIIKSRAKSAPVAYDGAAIEIRPAPGYCAAALSMNTRELLWNATAQFRLARLKGSIPRDSRISVAPAAMVRPEDMKLKSINQFGCNESLSVNDDLSVSVVRPLPGAEEVPFRTAGYHVHISNNQNVNTFTGKATPSLDVENSKESFLEKYVAPRVAILDAMVGLIDVMMVHLDGHSMESEVRRGLIGYGRGGEIRVRPYGEKNWLNGRMEYRTPSPWAMSSPMWSWWLQTSVRCIMDVGRLGPSKIGPLLERLPARSEITDAINRNDAKAARELWMASWRAWKSHGYWGDHESSGLETNNVYYMLLALNNGGHKFFDHKDMATSWFRNERVLRTGGAVWDPKTSNYKIKPYEGSHSVRYSTTKNRKAHPIVNRRMNTIHDKGHMRFFPSGPRYFLKEIHPEWALKLKSNEAYEIKEIV